MEQRIKAKIEAVGVPLKDWDINIYRGILTGFNEAFIIDENKRNEILANCKTDKERQKTDELIRPLLRGRDIKRYSYDFADLYLICTFPSKSYNIDEFPAVKKFLEGFKSKLEQTGKKLTKSEIYNVTEYAKSQGIEIKEKSLEKSRKKTNNKWFETQDSISYWEEFSKQKIVYSEIVREPQFYLDNEGKFFPEATSFIMTGNDLEYLYHLLHSKIITYFFKTFYAGGGLGKDGYRYKKAFLEKLPIPKNTSNITLNDANIEDFICEIFNLSTEEKNTIYEYLNDSDF
ncbi:TaqI-like C-terminal specificity domain-containing protein [Capnocytophaga canis]|uniref:TaqI-like C-terminal specificity domain-containing protein n=1 Tax=Capnocytophaga canis TaxID=1848903 RepID=UPI0015620EF5|nr:TaqI-like C-terminal specificity domain-containing protein [Capnocytophaga canis]